MGQVERPVGAVGRFGGTQYTQVGKVRANHPGVLCISTSPVGQIGGFQIIPSVHARESCLTYVWGSVAAWLIVRPLLNCSANLEGMSPLFMGNILPGSGRCEVRYGANSSWQPLPERIGKVEDGLAGVTEIRIKF